MRILNKTKRRIYLEIQEKDGSIPGRIGHLIDKNFVLNPNDEMNFSHENILQFCEISLIELKNQKRKAK